MLALPPDTLLCATLVPFQSMNMAGTVSESPPNVDKADIFAKLMFHLRLHERQARCHRYKHAQEHRLGSYISP